MTKPRYYAAVVRADGSMMMPPNGPYDQYDGAIQVHARSAAMLPSSFQRPPVTENRRVLLDLSSLGQLAPFELERVLMTDPALAAIYKMGESRGYERGLRQYNTRLHGSLDGRA